MKNKLTWKKNRYPSRFGGLACNHLGHTLKVSNRYVAHVVTHEMPGSDKKGWFWYTSTVSGRVPYRNTCSEEPVSEEQAKEDAMSFVEENLA